jgi:hypothetical protein
MDSESMPPDLNVPAVLDEVRRWHPEAPNAGSTIEADALMRFQQFFQPLAPERIEQLIERTYATDVYFNDTLKTVRGVAALRDYLIDSAHGAAECRVLFDEVTRTAVGEHHLRWRMMIRFKRFAGGRETWSVGMSHIRLGTHGLVVYQQDYWNAADGLFQHIPVLGTAIRAIKRRL